MPVDVHARLDEVANATDAHCNLHKNCTVL